MTIKNHDMTANEEDGFFDAVEKFNKTSSALKVIAWALGAMAAAGLAVAGWVWTVNDIQTEHSESFRDITPRVQALETRAVRFDAAPPPSQAQFYDIDKRLDRMEQNSLTLREQNSMILESLKKLESRP